MGAVFHLPLIQSDHLWRDLVRLRDEWRVELVATVLDDDATPLPKAQPSRRLGLLFGNEGQGLDCGVINLCNRKVTVPMNLGTDSLNVAVSAAVMLYHFTSVRP
jgi:TrmH family RNA methyltransferase